MVEAAVSAAHRGEWARVLASVVRLTRDLDTAEDSVQDAFLAALQTWERLGIPRNAGAWLTTTARRKALDRLRREHRLDRLLPQLIVTDESTDAAGSSILRDDRIRLIFTCCHPALDLHARVALTLRLICGLQTVEIADLFLVSEATMAARLTRAKKKIQGAGIAYRIPGEQELPHRMPAVLGSVYLLYTAGHTARRGPQLMRADALEDALRITELLADFAPREPEVLGLQALVLLGYAHRNARLDANGSLVPLRAQDRRRWDAIAIEQGCRLTRKALRLSGSDAGPYTLQAAIAAVHAEAPTAASTDWAQVVALYDLLLATHPSPVTALARAVAIGEDRGPEHGLCEIDRLADQPALAGHHRLFAARADLLTQLDRRAEARAAYQTAAALAENDVERRYLLTRATDSG